MKQETNLPLWKELKNKMEQEGKGVDIAHAKFEYQKLAKNHLHILAEALEKAFAWNETISQLAAQNRLDVESLSRNTQLIQSVIKDALNKIS